MLTTLWPEYRAWQEKNFPSRGLSRAILKLNEEAGELSAALYRDERDAAEDALGDIFISLMGVAHTQDFDFPSLYRPQTFKVAAPDATSIHCAAVGVTNYLGELNRQHHSGLITSHKIENTRRRFAIADFGMAVGIAAGLLGMELEQAVIATWAVVRERDYVRYPKKGVAA
jgi:NTP pyrophosphatase (non-canonical NTP hydrolase)